MAEHENGENKVKIIMKVDSPVEEPEKNEPEEDTQLEICSPSYNTIFSPSRHLKFNPFAKRFNNPLENNVSGKPLLRPSQFGQASKGFTLKPSKLEPKVSAVSENRHSVTTNHINGEPPVFVPLVVSDKKPTEIITPRTSSITDVENSHSFIFGQNLQERVVTDPSDELKPSTSTSVSSNGTNEMLFSSAAKESSGSKSVNNTDESTSKKTLSESAREYEERKSYKRKYEEVELVTGEEGETNILHVSCKLFTYDTTFGNWQERGRGNLRLNDKLVTENDDTYTQSRLVFRTSGVLKVILNTKIWAEMTVECASSKSIRFTAIDNSGNVKVYLAMANGDEIKQLYENMEARLTNEQKRQKKIVSNKNSEDIQTQ